MTQIVVCSGAGGVGKTTTSAALGLALAQKRGPTLVLTVDPARRLAGALGIEVANAEGGSVEVGSDVQRLPVAARHALDILMPEPRQATRAFAEVLFDGHPSALERVLANEVYRTLADATAGMHELVCLMRLADLAASGRYHAIVVDTAPSRNALDFLAFPERLTRLLDGAAVRWIGALGSRAAESREPGLSRAGFHEVETRALEASARPAFRGRVRRSVDAAIGRVLPARVVGAVAQLFLDIALVRERFVALSDAARSLVTGPRATHVLVAAPTEAACEDAAFLAARIGELGARPSAVLLNRAEGQAVPSHLVPDCDAFPEALRPVVGILRREREAAVARTDVARRFLRERLPETTTIELPDVEDARPAEVVHRLGSLLEDELGVLFAPPQRQAVARS